MFGKGPKTQTTERTSPRARRAISPLLAIVVHGIVALAVFRVSPKPPAVAGPTASEPGAIEVAITEVPLEAERPRGELGATEAPRAREKSALRPSTTSRETSSPAPGEAGESAPAEATESTAAGEPRPDVTAEGPSFVRPSATDIGVGGGNRFLPKSDAEIEAAVAKREKDNLLRHTGWERDRSLGLGPEGPVLTALSDATSSSVAPVRGRAIFIATTNAAGEVESLELREAEGGRPGWADARRIAALALVGKKLRVPSSAKRVQMTIEVVSAWKLPSGQDPGTDVTLFHVPVAKGEGKDSAKVTILDPIPKLRMVDIDIAPGVKIPIPTLEVTIFGATTDPSNIGAKPRRIIHAHLVDSTVM